MVLLGKGNDGIALIDIMLKKTTDFKEKERIKFKDVGINIITKDDPSGLLLRKEAVIC